MESVWVDLIIASYLLQLDPRLSCSWGRERMKARWLETLQKKSHAESYDNLMAPLNFRPSRDNDFFHMFGAN